MSVLDFCLENRVSSGQLYAYRRRFEEEPEDVTLPALVPVHVVDSQDGAGAKEIGGAVEVAW